MASLVFLFFLKGHYNYHILLNYFKTMFSAFFLSEFHVFVSLILCCFLLSICIMFFMILLEFSGERKRSCDPERCSCPTAVGSKGLLNGDLHEAFATSAAVKVKLEFPFISVYFGRGKKEH